MRKVVVVMIFLSLYAQDPLINFALNSRALTFGQPGAVNILDVFYKDKSVYVVYVTDHVFISRYDAYGNEQLTQRLHPNGSDFYVPANVQVLWDDEAIYIPGFLVDGPQDIASVQKYSYDLVLDTDFNLNLFNDNAYFQCIVKLHDKYFAFGNEIGLDINHAVANGHIIVDFNSQLGTVIKEYKEADLTSGAAPRTFVDVRGYYENGHYAFHGLSSDNKFSFVLIDNLTDDITVRSSIGRILQGNAFHDLQYDKVAFLDNQRMLFVDNVFKIFVITIIQTDGSGHIVYHSQILTRTITTDPFDTDYDPIITSMFAEGNTLFLAGDYQIPVNGGGVLYSPFIMAYDITNFNNDHILNSTTLKKTFFDGGRLQINEQYQTTPFKSLMRAAGDSFFFGYQEKLRYIFIGKFLKNILNQNFLPFAS